MGLLREKQQLRVAASSLEVLVAFTLLTCVLSLSMPLVVRHGRLLSAQRDYRLALDELSNQLDRLGALPLPELPAALRILTPSPLVAERLPGAELTAELKPIDLGTRLTLRLSWDEPERHQAPVTMTGWILPESPPAGDQTAEDDAS